ncbi:hypothetical protein PTKIN_Ptkin13bG0004200 [Pterospermum kingtungense]
MQIKADVETQGEFVNSLIREVNSVVYQNIKDVVAFVKWLDDELCYLNPIYFAFENEEIDTVLVDMKKNDAIGQPATATTGGYKLVISTLDPKKVASPTITNIQGWLSGLKADGEANQLPTIAIVASYDTFGAAPALSVGSDSNGSGIVVLLEIARLFSLLYSNPKTRGRYNLLFGLTSDGPYNYNGTQKWLRSFDQRLRESIDYAIYGFSNAAEELDLKVGLKHKKINISNPRVYFIYLRKHSLDGHKNALCMHFCCLDELQRILGATTSDKRVERIR